ncbi:uncharacterized protein BDZ83DRAFT_441153 [Colletotrichum acutatum]|uniref:Secreted protein n=1 Tax=Glomerella acutata TaxID=27357 RepID=A0AAD8UK50_GLOAC|nr:uncharacterized protein BDZ83DRAFT_441153 [Colletotrichum acutatum]KAK1721219.1 hypothetical protein BDZ83DRAFT_441153 [Colletotrichum acutatum]
MIILLFVLPRAILVHCRPRYPAEQGLLHLKLIKLLPVCSVRGKPQGSSALICRRRCSTRTSTQDSLNVSKWEA